MCYKSEKNHREAQFFENVFPVCSQLGLKLPGAVC